MPDDPLSVALYGNGGSVPAGNVTSAPTLRTDSLMATVLDVPSLISANVAFEFS